MKNLLPLLFVLTFIQGISAQVTITDTERHASAALGETLDAKQIANRFGTPESQKTFLDDFDNTVTIYDYPQLQLVFTNGKLHDFRISGAKYSIVFLNGYSAAVGKFAQSFITGIPSSKVTKHSQNLWMIHYDDSASLVLSTDNRGVIDLIYWYVII